MIKSNIYQKIVFVAVGVVLGALLVTMGSVKAVKEESKVSLPIEEIRAFVEVFDRVSSHYVEEVEDNKLLENAISGMLSNLDPHSSYLPKESFAKMEESTKGEFGGLGMEVGTEDGFVKVVAPIDDTPAQKAGIKSGDLIIMIDSKPTKGMDLNEAVKLMRGEPGSKIKLTLVSKHEREPREVSLTRAIIKVKSVRSRILDSNVGYVRISQFQVRTGADLVKTVKELEKENGAPLNGLVLDLRNNPGGVLNASVDVSNAFLDEGLIVYTEGRIPNSEMRFNAKNGDLLKGKPIVVLVNEGSASASEIVAGALQDHNRGLIVGRSTFGKGSVQTLLPLNNGAAIKLTTARYFTPSGRSIQAEGIKPDIEIDLVKVEKIEQANLMGMKEADLDGHLVNSNEAEEVEDLEDETEDLLSSDYELYEALNLLKGMIFSQNIKQ